jgi:HTH-type transcriptional regulator/antitoxin HigA
MTTRKAPSLVTNLAIPPGETLAEELEARGMTQRDLAAKIGRPPQAVNEIIRGKKSITADTALALEEALEGISAKFWLNLQADYDLTLARRRRRTVTA